MLRPKALNPALEPFPFGTQLRGQRPRRNVVSEDRRLALQFAKVKKAKDYTYISQLPRDRCRHAIGSTS
jgi:hypothetical protein